MTITDAVRRTVYARDAHACVVGDQYRVRCSEGLTLQHRINRGMGGSDLLDGFANLVTMCGLHNQRLEGDALFATLGRRLGWKLESWEDPFKVAVFSPVYGGWRLLNGTGGLVPVTARDPERREALDADRYAEWRTQ